jgi:hypothetical protein
MQNAIRGLAYVASAMMTMPLAQAAANPVTLTGNCSFTQNDGRCIGSKALTASNATIEFASALCEIAADQQPAAYLKLQFETQQGKKTEYYLAPSNSTFRPQSNRTNTSFTYPTRIYLQNAAKLSYEFQIPNSGVGGECRLTLQGK